MDEPYPLAAASYVELNPVRARLAEQAGDWRWSTTRAHLDGCDSDQVEACAA
jgi:putative transposase